MGKRVYIAPAVVAVALVSVILAVALIVGVVISWPARASRVEPVYEGKALSAWMRDFDQVPENRLAAKAIRQIGTDAIPLLLRMFAADDHTMKARLFALLSKQQVVKVTYVPAEVQHGEALEGFAALGGAADSALPELTKMYYGMPSRQADIAFVFACMGPAAREAIPCLLLGLKSSDVSVRASSLRALGNIHAEAQSVVPAMVSSLRDPDDGVRSSAVAGLSKFGTNAYSALPGLRLRSSGRA